MVDRKIQATAIAITILDDALQDTFSNSCSRNIGKQLVVKYLFQIRSSDEVQNLVMMQEHKLISSNVMYFKLNLLLDSVLFDVNNEINEFDNFQRKNLRLRETLAKKKSKDKFVTTQISNRLEVAKENGDVILNERNNSSNKYLPEPKNVLFTAEELKDLSQANFFDSAITRKIKIKNENEEEIEDGIVINSSNEELSNLLGEFDKFKKESVNELLEKEAINKIYDESNNTVKTVKMSSYHYNTLNGLRCNASDSLIFTLSSDSVDSSDETDSEILITDKEQNRMKRVNSSDLVGFEYQQQMERYDMEIIVKDVINQVLNNVIINVKKQRINRLCEDLFLKTEDILSSVIGPIYDEIVWNAFKIISRNSGVTNKSVMLYENFDVTKFLSDNFYKLNDSNVKIPEGVILYVDVDGKINQKIEYPDYYEPDVKSFSGNDNISNQIEFNENHEEIFWRKRPTFSIAPSIVKDIISTDLFEKRANLYFGKKNNIKLEESIINNGGDMIVASEKSNFQKFVSNSSGFNDKLDDRYTNEDTENIMGENDENILINDKIDVPIVLAEEMTSKNDLEKNISERFLDITEREMIDQSQENCINRGQSYSTHIMKRLNSLKDLQLNKAKSLTLLKSELNTKIILSTDRKLDLNTLGTLHQNNVKLLDKIGIKPVINESNIIGTELLIDQVLSEKENAKPEVSINYRNIAVEENNSSADYSEDKNENRPALNIKKKGNGFKLKFNQAFSGLKKIWRKKTNN